MWEQELGRLREAAAQQLMKAEWRHEDEVAKLRLKQVRGSGRGVSAGVGRFLHGLILGAT